MREEERSSCCLFNQSAAAQLSCQQKENAYEETQKEIIRTNIDKENTKKKEMKKNMNRTGEAHLNGPIT